ncbi:MAG: ORF6N domain-containing protein [Lentimicrobiaceae bacterium]|nr:ORF6N domain-containing protein [Lentimicrobiaceae bacterium]
METNIIVQDRTKESAEFSFIYSKIYEIRGYKVMLDFDLANIYEVENKYLKRSVRSNIERFEGDDFMFELTREELSRCSFGTLNKGRGHNIKYLPFAFTQLGVAMLSSVLNSEKAIKMNRQIMRAFVSIQQYALTYEELKQELETYMDKTDRKLDTIFEVLDKLISHKKALEKPRTPIGFKQKEI